MNQRIEKMMLEATKDIPQGYYVPPQYFEKFAELIVRECARINFSNIVGIDPEDDAAVGRAIKKHFGVEA